MKFNFNNAKFEYEPYPICYIPNFLDKADYKILQESYPNVELFKFKQMLGDKYSLAEKNNSEFYYNFLKENKAWKDFYKAIKSKAFIQEIQAFLRDHNIDLGIRRFRYTGDMNKSTRGLIWRAFNKKMLRSRFEFSVMRANGGHILPHTDAPNKIVTLVLSFINDNEWDPAWGGGTDMLLPKDRTKVYNYMNGQMPFEEMETIRTFPFNANQAILFIKTFNSWHSVSPMTGPESGLRKTVTINIENII